MNRKTKDTLIVALTVLSGIIVLAPSAVAAAASVLALIGGLF
ncbi:hypothetical protein [Pelagibacterium lacus]|nr:hypothetical protein [Pelagibacterium lacus]